jgi:hypothetical protein
MNKIQNNNNLENSLIIDSSSSDENSINLNNNDSSGTENNYHHSSDDDSIKSSTPNENELDTEFNDSENDYHQSTDDEETESNVETDNQTIATDINYHISSDDDNDDINDDDNSVIDEFEINNIIDTFTVSTKIKHKLMHKYVFLNDELNVFKSSNNINIDESNEKKLILLNEFIIEQFDKLFSIIIKLTIEDIELLINNNYFYYFNKNINWEIIRNNSTYNGLNILSDFIDIIYNKYN